MKTLDKKISFDKKCKTLLVTLGLTYVFFIAYFLSTIIECEAYWMHDASIEISHKWLLIHCTYLFVLPVIILLFQYKTKLSTVMFWVHYSFALISISLFAISIATSDKKIVNSHYIFINGLPILGYYLFKLLTLVSICFIIYKFILALINHK